MKSFQFLATKEQNMNMKQKQKKISFWEDFKLNLNGYLRETTLHGVRYLADGHNWFEILFWVLAIGLGFYFNILMMVTSLEENYENPILTTIDTIPITNVPFPAITVSGGNTLNPWGYTEKVMNLAKFENYDNPLEPDESDKLRGDFHFLFKAIVDRMNGVFGKENRTLQELQEFKRYELMFANQIGDSFERIAAMMAHIEEKDQERGKRLYKDLAHLTAASLAKFTPSKPQLAQKFGTDILFPLVNEASKSINISEEDYRPCWKNQGSCPSTYINAYMNTMHPFVINRIPYLGLGFGHLIEFFTYRVISSQAFKAPIPFLNEKSAKGNEAKVEAYLKKLVDNISGKDLDVSVYELVKYFDMNYTPGTESQTRPLEHKFKCKYNNYFGKWKKYLKQREEAFPKPCSSNFTFDEVSGIAGCCQIAKELEKEYDTVLKIMKYSMQAPHFMQSKEEAIADFRNVRDIVEYPVIPINGTSGARIPIAYQRNWDPRVFICQYNQKPKQMNPSNCNLFSRRFTNEGLGYSFNVGNFWDKHMDSEYNRKFFEIMHPDVNEDNTNEIIHPETSGPAYGLKLNLKLNRFRKEAEGVSKRSLESPVFKLVVHDPDMPADLRSGGVEIEPGYLSTFLITASQIVTMDDMKGLEIPRRKCQFRSENQNMTIFKDYTYTGCIMECQIKQAFEICQCVPWNYPFFDGVESVCDSVGSYCFEEVMSSTATTKTCDCHYDCDSIRYSYSVSSTTLDIKKICKKDKQGNLIYGGSHYASPNKFMRNYQKYVEGTDINIEDICSENLNGIAIVHFQMTSEIVTQIKRSIRVSFADNVSNFGGTVGLLTGMSMLSVFEIIFWIVRLLTGTGLKSKGLTRK